MWFKFNDRVRNEKELFQTEGDEFLWRTNLEALLDMLTMSDPQSMQMRAEIHRNFGNFQEAIRVLENIRLTSNPKSIEFLIDQCKLGNKLVVAMP